MKTNLKTGLAVLLLGHAVLANGAPGSVSCVWEPATQSAQVTSDYLDATVSLAYPGFTGLSVDSLGKEHFPQVTMRAPAKPWPEVQAIRHGAWIEYRLPGNPGSGPPRWALKIGRQEIQLESRWSAVDPPEPLVLEAENSACHVTLLGHLEPDGSVQLPAIMHFPDQGSFRISATPKAVKALGYATGPGDMGANQAKAVKITFPGATREIPVVKYRWEVVAIHPKVAAIGADARFDGFRRNWLNILQLSPHWRMLANHAASDTCAFCYYEYADIAERTPALAKGAAALDLVRQTLDRIMGGANAYGMPGHGSFPEFSADTLPSLLIAAQAYIAGSKDQRWLTTNYARLEAWADKMLATDHDGNGLSNTP